MERIQKLFDFLVGISVEENARLARAKAIFAQTGPDIASLQIPACWRRPVQVSRFRELAEYAMCPIPTTVDR